ncbi:hypothetical protein SUNI508_12064 [Seiridium unicorne]|uniref:Uncharacterized protein n=1 Tax=Seiridium unicorne TaxID=138068 RepID=A0ABR2UEX4_9PEZI
MARSIHRPEVRYQIQYSEMPRMRKIAMAKPVPRTQVAQSLDAMPPSNLLYGVPAWGPKGKHKLPDTLHGNALGSGHDPTDAQHLRLLLHLDNFGGLRVLILFYTLISDLLYVVFPATFTSIRDLSDDPDVQANAAANTVLDHVKNVPLLVIAAICCGIGASGMIWLMIRWRKNYVWLLNRLLLPGAMNGLAGLIGTLATVYTQQNGDWNITAKMSAIVEGCSMVICGVLFVFFNNLLLARVKRKHGREMEQAQADEGFLEKAERILHEPALEPGSVV